MLSLRLGRSVGCTGHWQLIAGSSDWCGTATGPQLFCLCLVSSMASPVLSQACVYFCDKRLPHLRARVSCITEDGGWETVRDWHSPIASCVSWNIPAGPALSLHTSPDFCQPVLLTQPPTPDVETQPHTNSLSSSHNCVSSNPFNKAFII